MKRTVLLFSISSALLFGILASPAGNATEATQASSSALNAESQESPDIKQNWINEELEQSLLDVASRFESTRTNGDGPSQVAMHLRAAARAAGRHDQDRLVKSMRKAQRQLDQLGLGVADLEEAGIPIPSSIENLDALIATQPLPTMLWAGGGTITSITLWDASCVAGYITCWFHHGGPACDQLLEICFELCKMEFGSDDEPDVDPPPCRSACQQTKQVASNPRLVHIDPASEDCEDPPLISTIEGRFSDSITKSRSWDWMVDPEVSCPTTCSCEGSGDGQLTAETRRRFPLTLVIDECKITGSALVTIRRWRRNAECVANGL